MSKKLSIWTLALLVFTSLVLRFFLSYLPSFDIDMGTWVSWSNMLVARGPWNFYDPNIWTHYLPGYLYILLGLGWVDKVIGSFIHINNLLPLLIKISTTFFDIGTALLIYSLIKKVSRKWAILCAALYVFNPVLIFNSNVWGQADGVLGFFLLLTIVALDRWRQPLLSSLFLGFSFLIKPQAIAILPIWFLLLLKTKSLKTIFTSIAVVALTLLLFSFPFFPASPLFGLPRLFWQMAGDYPYTSLFAFNFWYIVGAWKLDNQTFAGLSLSLWGVLVFTVSSIVIIWLYYRQKLSPYLVSALFLLSFFLFPTRVHERYLYPFFAFLLVALGQTRSTGLLALFLGYSAVHLANLYYVYAYYTPNWLKIESLRTLVEMIAPLLSLSSIIGLIFIVKSEVSGRLLNIVTHFFKARLRQDTYSQALPELGWVVRYRKKLLIIILLFAAATRLIHLDIPNTYMFDEVYHAFTAREILLGHKVAWEWWNTPPEGFAYEWSHPPLAKEFMVAGLMLSNSPLGWRLPGAILGTASVLFVFLICWEIFHNWTISILSAALFSFDHLALVMSRIGMNDSYFLFFLLVAVWFLLRQRFLLMGIAFGLSLASKWTAIYFVGLIFFVWISRGLWKNVKKTSLIAVSCVLLVPLVYLFSYFPFFTWGHTAGQFIELQKQMWYYHTGLHATHPFQSSWWSWPLMLRPVWLYVDYGTKTIANIYVRGNPLFYWLGIVSTFFALAIGIKRRDLAIRNIVFPYLLFFLPWAFSPRIMFLYHFLPSTPFLAMIVAWFLLFAFGVKYQRFITVSLLVIFASFIFFFPNVTAIPVPTTLDKIFYWLPSWK
jgi:predicted membrane-bound dolichyl-phosphate-mannose-protein mannosyltransferase